MVSLAQRRAIDDFLKDSVHIEDCEGIPTVPVSPASMSMTLGANAQYFGHPDWAKPYFEACHREQTFIDRWHAAAGSWDDKVVVDIGCGPGNVFASLGGKPSTLIGVDVSLGGLKMAQELGYEPLLADAQALPLRSEIADIVAVNATLHHCDDMAKALSEAARLVKPGGVLVCDHDPQRSAWHFQGLARVLWDIRLPLYRLVKRGGHASPLEQACALATEAHHRPSDGMTVELYRSILDPMGFETQIFPHNHTLGAEVFQHRLGRASQKYRWAQRLSGLDPNSPEAALSLMCVARKKK